MVGEPIIERPNGTATPKSYAVKMPYLSRKSTFNTKQNARIRSDTFCEMSNSYSSIDIKDIESKKPQNNIASGINKLKLRESSR